jgi:cytochrome c oxidase assembly protein subunit 15
MGNPRSGLLFMADAPSSTAMRENNFNPALHGFALAVALCSLGLIAMGGLVTSHGVGMAVPDWPTSYGYNMFALPVSTWLTGGVFQEHTHRLWASFVGVLVVALTRWLGGRKSRLPLAIIGVAETAGGQLLLLLGPDWKGAGYFLSGIGGVVLLASLVWVRNEPAARPLPRLGWLAFWLVQFQGLLGGLRVVLDAHVFAGTKLGVWFGVVHGCLGQVFLVLLAVIALMTSRWWLSRFGVPPSGGSPHRVNAGLQTSAHPLLLLTTALIFLQLMIGATMRHQHAGLAIPDFPLAYGQWWPDMGDAAVLRYNAARVEVAAQNPITTFQIGLQMIHRLMAVVILTAVAACFWRLRKRFEGGHLLCRLGGAWLALVLTQAGLGAWTIWSIKAADIATLHVVAGALTLVGGALICIIHFRCCGSPESLASEAFPDGLKRPD